ncbi:PaaI family thioesterase [Bradyrhizobium sp. 18BD]
MTAFEPKNPGYRAAAIAMFDGQPAMHTLGIVIVRLAPGEVELAMLHSPALTQQNGFVHAGIITAGLDNACGVAAFTLMPSEADILTVEFKTTLLAPARGERFVFRAEVVKPGRTLTFCEARAFAEHDGKTTLIATMTGTLMAMLPREAPQAARTSSALRSD